MGHYFHGYLAGLSVLRNQTETDDVIRCLNNCQEKLEVPGIDDMENGMVGANSGHFALEIWNKLK